MTVEIDESHIYTRKPYVGRVLEKEKVSFVGGKCRETKQFYFVDVNQRNKVILNNIILNNIEEGTNIITYKWRGYTDVSRVGFTHNSVNHSINFVDPDDSNIHTRIMERECVKQFLPKLIKGTRVQNYLYLYLFLKEKNAKHPSEVLGAMIYFLNL